MKLVALFPLVAVFLCGGCSHNIPYPTSMNFDAQSMEYVGQVYAESGQGYMLCTIPLGDGPDLTAALASAVKARGADAAINVLAESESGIFLGIYCWRMCVFSDFGNIIHLN